MCAVGGVKIPAEDLKAMAPKPAVPFATPCVIVGATPVESLRTNPSLNIDWKYGELQPFQGPGPLPNLSWMMMSVAGRGPRPIAVQTPGLPGQETELDPVLVEVSKEATDAEGGINSYNQKRNIPTEAPVRVIEKLANPPPTPQFAVVGQVML